jgi:hypothetical protein
MNNDTNTDKTLVIILSETRAHELTYDNFKKNVIDELNADLCVCIGITPEYDINNPYYKLAKYKFLYDEPTDFGDAFEYAYNIISLNKPKYEILNNINALYAKLPNPCQSTDNITYYGNTYNITIDDYNDEIVVHTKDFYDINWKDQVYGIKNSYDNLISQENVITYKKPLYWREFLKIKNQFLGGIKDEINEQLGSGGILIFFRWFLLKNLIENDLIKKYDRFIITRSDFIYQLPHPKVNLMNENNIWIPDAEHYGGYTDRHVVLSQNNIISYLNILNNIVLRSNEYFIKMKLYNEWNLEQLIKFHLQQNNIEHLVKEFPYIMYSVRTINGNTRWTNGIYSNELGYYIKYYNEYNKSNYYKDIFIKSNLSIDEFYKKHIHFRKVYNIVTPLPLNTLESYIINEYEEDLKFIDITAFINGVNTHNYDQIPDVCKKFMCYNNNYELKWSNEMIDEMLYLCNNLEYNKLSPNDYPNASLQFVEVFNKFVNISEKNCVVLGSISPWIECLLLHFNAKNVTTLDYIIPECNYKINTLSIENFNNKIKYDIVVSFSSLEHDGLGRYGDPINPNGDIDACIEAYSILNNGGYFICGIPIGSGNIQGNFHRIYNKKRLTKLFSLFDTFIGYVNYQNFYKELDFTGNNWQNQPIFIYKKN